MPILTPPGPSISSFPVLFVSLLFPSGRAHAKLEEGSRTLHLPRSPGKERQAVNEKKQYTYGVLASGEREGSVIRATSTMSPSSSLRGRQGWGRAFLPVTHG